MSSPDTLVVSHGLMRLRRPTAAPSRGQMSNLKLTLACWDYDRTRALFDGRVRPEGIELELWSTYNVGEIMERMIKHRQFDVSELGITYYLRSIELMGAPL